MKTLYFFILTLLPLTCSNKLQTKFPVAIEDVYYQGWVAGVRGGGAGTSFVIQFKNEIPKSLKLESIYFRNRKAAIQITNGKTAMANFVSDANRMENEMVTDEPKQPVKSIEVEVKPPYKIREDEAVLEYTENNKKKFYKITKIKEREMIAYPSARPQFN